MAVFFYRLGLDAGDIGSLLRLHQCQVGVFLPVKSRLEVLFLLFGVAVKEDGGDVTEVKGNDGGVAPVLAQ